MVVALSGGVILREPLVPRMILPGVRRPVRLLVRDQVNVVLAPLAIEFGEIDAVQLGRSVTIVSDMRAKYPR